MRTQIVDYYCGSNNHKGYLAYMENGLDIKPGILIAHAWRGQDDFARKKAEDLARLGYVAFAADLYGNGISVVNNEEAAKLMMPLFADRQALRDRIVAAFQTLVKTPGVDKNRIGAIGFCFGGLTVLELSRSGQDLKGVVSFHGLLGEKLEDVTAKTAKNAEIRKGAVLILHGYKDPLVSQSDINNMQKELSDAKLDWQMHIYGEAIHAFTNPAACDPEMGFLYDAKADKRSWLSMCNFFKEVFS